MSVKNINSLSGSLPLFSRNITLSNGQTDATDIIDLQGTALLSIYIPTGFTGNSLSFKVDSNLTSDNLKQFKASDGTEVNMAVTPDTCIGIVPIDFAGVRFLQIVSNVSQVGDIEFIIKARRV